MSKYNSLRKKYDGPKNEDEDNGSATDPDDSLEERDFVSLDNYFHPRAQAADRDAALITRSKQRDADVVYTFSRFR